VKSSMNKGVSKRKTSPRNPSWTTDELILALDLYLKNPLFPPSKNSKDIVELSDLLNKLGKKLSNIKTHTYRNPNGIYMKLMNFRRFDPKYTSNGKVGLQRGGKQDEVIWNKFTKNPNRCHQVAQAIRVSIESHKLTPEEYKDFNDEEAIEGKALTAMHFKRERSRKLVEQRKKQFIRKYGRLFCEACNFDFEERYGKKGSYARSLRIEWANFNHKAKKVNTITRNKAVENDLPPEKWSRVYVRIRTKNLGSLLWPSTSPTDALNALRA